MAMKISDNRGTSFPLLFISHTASKAKETLSMTIQETADV